MTTTNHFFKRKEKSTHWLQVMSTTVKIIKGKINPVKKILE